jgi:hypothetical protein
LIKTDYEMIRAEYSGKQWKREYGKWGMGSRKWGMGSGK